MIKKSYTIILSGQAGNYSPMDFLSDYRITQFIVYVKFSRLFLSTSFSVDKMDFL